MNAARRHCVVFYKTDLPDTLLKHTSFTRIKNFKSHTEWMAVIEEFHAFTNKFGHLLDLDRIEPQHQRFLANRLITELEHIDQFVALIKQHYPSSPINIEQVGISLNRNALDQLFIASYLKKTGTTIRLSSFYTQTMTALVFLGYALKSFVKIIQSTFQTNISSATDHILLDGINIQNMEATTNAFTNPRWLIEENILNNTAKVFILSSKFHNRSTQGNIYQLLTFSEKLSSLKLLINSTFRYFFNPYSNFVGPALRDGCATEILVRKQKISEYITTLSNAWPEDIFPSILSHYNIKTTAWLYTNGEFYFSETPSFSDINIRLSFPSFDKIIYWHDETAKHIQARQIARIGKIVNKCQHVGSVPMFYGEFGALDLSPMEARKKYFGLTSYKTIISAFDISVMKSEHLINRGVGPYITVETETLFYEGIYDLLKLNSEIIVMLKPKREELSIFESLPIFQRILEDFKERVILVSPHINPITVIQSSDIVISTLITSASFLGKYTNRAAYWYDPSCRGLYFSEFFPKDKVIHSFEELNNQVLLYKRRDTYKKLSKSHIQKLQEAFRL